MDGAKSITDTVDLLRECDRQVFCEGRSTFERRCGPCKITYPDGSRIKAVCESLSLKGQGFLGNAVQPRVS